MNPERLLTVPCTIVARVPSGEDAYGAPTVVEQTTAERCWYSSPTTEERNGQVFTAVTLYFGPDAVLDHITQVEVEGIGSFEIDGDPLAHRSPRTGVLTHRTARGRAGA
jgi:hypothetical protein